MSQFGRSTYTAKSTIQDVQQIRAQKKYRIQIIHFIVTFPLLCDTHSNAIRCSQGKDAVIKERRLVFIDLDPLKIFQMEGVTISDGNLPIRTQVLPRDQWSKIN